MNNLEAKKHLLVELCSKGVMDKDSLEFPGWFLAADSDSGILDGEFTADDLEAIVLWMRDPEAVIDS